MKGNAVMKAKRVTGPTPNTVLCLRVKLEHCHVKGCDKPVVLVRNPDGTTTKRSCRDHIIVKSRALNAARVAGITSRGWRPGWMS